jgi:hypothetical protein
MIEKMVDAIAFVRANAGMFFNDGVPDEFFLTQSVVKDLSLANVKDFTVKFQWPFVEICSSVDWMESSNQTIEHLFSNIVPRGAGYQNEHRSELLIAASCDMIYCIGSAGNYILWPKDTSYPDVQDFSGRKSGRLLLFSVN